MNKSSFSPLDCAPAEVKIKNYKDGILLPSSPQKVKRYPENPALLVRHPVLKDHSKLKFIYDNIGRENFFSLRLIISTKEKEVMYVKG